MRIVFLLAVVFLLPAVQVSAQTYHQPREILTIMEKSAITYGVQTTDEDIPAEDFSSILVLPGTYIALHEDGTTSLENYTTRVSASPAATAALKRAEEAFAADDMPAARRAYLEVLDIIPEHSTVLTYMGQTYEHEKDRKTAIEWLEKAVAANPVDYMAHWFLADNYAETGELDRAMEHITLAHILNRNNPRLLFSLKRIYDKNGTPFDDWEFRPNCTVDTTEEGKPMITVTKEDGKEWMIYAFCHALWRFEPGYPETVMEGAQVPAFIVAEKEALINLVVSAANLNGEEPSSDPAIRMLARSVDDEQFEEFLYYEVILRRYPSVALMIAEKDRKRFADYVTAYHTQQ